MPRLTSEFSNPLSRPEIIFESAQFGHGFYQDSVHLMGFGFDGTACFRKGTVFGPKAIRDISYGIETYSPYLDADVEDINLIDCGDLQLGDSDDVDQQWQVASDHLTSLIDAVELKANAVKLVTLGGEHSISYAPIVAHLKQYPNMVLLHLDAHADLRDGYEGHHYSHASIIYRVQEHFGPEHQLIQYGIRSGTKEEYQWMSEHNSLCRSRDEFLARVDAIDAQTPIYLTLDLDYFDPSFFPGTGTPEPGGEDFHSFVALVKRLAKKNFIGCDVVELSPPIDQTGNSDVFAAKVVRELVLAMQANQDRGAK